jgi:hypothetical protein
MRKLWLIISLVYCYVQLSAQDLPEFLNNPKFNRPGNAPIINRCKGPVNLPKVKPDEAYVSTGRTFSITAENEVVTWGRGRELPGIFFRENLPSIFTRHLEFDSFSFPTGIFEWVFTGDRAGINLAISTDTIWFYQRYYDSYGFNEPKGDQISVKRHPEDIWLLHAIHYSGEPQNITISLDHKMVLSLEINGTEVSEQSCLFDVTEHQLRFTGESPEIRGELKRPGEREATVRIDWSDKKQKMLGWGGIATPTAYHILSPAGKALWWEYLLEYNLLLHREYPNGQNLAPDFSNWDKLEDATPHYYGDNFPNGEISDFDYIRRVQELGGISIFEFWQFPARVQNEEKRLDIDAYCQAMLNYCRWAKEKTGRPPGIVGIQNEVRQTEENWHRMTLALRKALDDNGFTGVRIHQQDMGRIQNGIQSAQLFASHREVWSAIDFAATHMYDYQSFFHDPDSYDSLMQVVRSVIGDKPFLSTELCINHPEYQTGSYRLAFTMAQLYHKNLTITNASAIMYCWTLLNTVQPSYEATRSLFGVGKINGFLPYPSSFQLRTFGSFSRRIKKDMYRISAHSSQADLLVTAFQGEAGETLVLLNRSNQQISCTVPQGMDPYRFVERTSQYFQNQLDLLQDGKDDQCVITIYPGEIITLSTVELNKPAEIAARIKDTVEIAGQGWPVNDLPGDLFCAAEHGVIYQMKISDCRSVGPRFEKFGGAARAVKAPNGDYLAMVCGDGYYQSDSGKVNDAWLFRSKDKGLTWSEGENPWIYEDASQHLLVPFIDPDRPDRIYVFGNESRDRKHSAKMVYRYSDDNGYNWSEAIPIVPRNDPYFPGAPIHMRGTVMPDGSWLWGCYYRGDGLHGDTQYLLRSTDKGKTWTLYPEAHPNGWKHPDWNKFMEGSILSLGGKQAVLYLRAQGGHMYEKRTRDGGKTWTGFRETPDLVHPDAPPMVFKLSDGKTLIAFHHNRYDPGNPNHWHPDRGELWFSSSDDQGKSWSEPRFIVAQTEKVNAGPTSVKHDVSYVDLLVDGGELNLFVGHGQCHTVLIKFHEKDLEKFYTMTEIQAFLSER